MLGLSIKYVRKEGIEVVDSNADTCGTEGRVIRAARRPILVGDSGALPAQKDSRKNFVLSSKFSDDLF